MALQKYKDIESNKIFISSTTVKLLGYLSENLKDEHLHNLYKKHDEVLVKFDEIKVFKISLNLNLFKLCGAVLFKMYPIKLQYRLFIIFSMKIKT